MLDVELRLRPGIEAHHQLLQTRSPGYDHQLLVHGYFPEVPISDLSRSGDTLSSPIFWALSAISWKASAIIAFGSAVLPPSIIKVFQSRSRSGFSVSVRV